MSGGAPSLTDAGIPYRIVYRRFKAADGAWAYEKYELPEIDAVSAARNHGQEYRLDEPWPDAKPAQIIDLVQPKLVVQPELLPAGHNDPIEPQPRRGFGGSHEIKKPDVTRH
jgi:hypothetical protein